MFIPCTQQKTLEQVGLQPRTEEKPAPVRHDRHIAEDVLGHPVADGQHRHDGGHDPTPGAPPSADHCQPELRERRVLSVRTATRVPADHDHPARHAAARVPDDPTAGLVAHPHRTPQHAAAKHVQIHTPGFGPRIAVDRRSRHAPVAISCIEHFRALRAVRHAHAHQT